MAGTGKAVGEKDEQSALEFVNENSSIEALV
jgi:hypothetical protein